MSEKASDGSYNPYPDFDDWLSEDFDSSVVDRYVNLLIESRNASSPTDYAEAVQVAQRYAAVDTGAIEGLYSVDRGFTRTIATQAASWELVLDGRGESVRRAIMDALDAYDYVLDATTRRIPMSQVWIRELHSLVCSSQESYTVYTQHGPKARPLPKGAYKSMPNSPTNASTGKVHQYASVADTGPEMTRLIAQLNSEGFLSAHPVLQAAYAHYAYVCVHPFADGNGRVARALASVYLYRLPGVPLVVFADQRVEYLDALERADSGDASDFVTFIEQRTVDAIGIVRAALRQKAPIATSIAAISSHLGDGLPGELLLAARNVRNLASAEAEKVISAQTLPPQLTVTIVNIQLQGQSVAIPDGYAEIGPDGALLPWAKIEWPREVTIWLPCKVVIRANTAAPSDIAIFAADGDPLEIWFREVSPILTQSFKMKLSTWVEAHMATLFQKVERALAAAP